MTSQDKPVEVLWEYSAKTEHLEEFTRMYSADGEWARLFGAYPGYLGTRLVQDVSHRTRFITIDRWVSHDAYQEMKNRSRSAYKMLDERCEIFTTSENYLGVFEVL